MTNRTDEIIDATLAALRTTPPPTGLEDRLLQTLEAAQQQGEVRGRVPHVSILRHGWTTNLFSLRLWIPTSVVAAAIIAVTLFYLHPISTPVISTAGAGSPANALVRGGAEALLRRSGEIPAFPSAHSASTEQQTQTSVPTNTSVILSEAQRSRRTPRLSTDHNSPDLSTPRPGFVTSTPTLYEQAALANTLAPSQPAPPLPLTQQERLLLRCTRRGQPIEVANLDLNQEGPFQAAAEAREEDLQRHIKSLLSALADGQPPDSAPSP